MLGRHLMRMMKVLPDLYNFFPYSYMLPHDFKDLMEDIALNNQKRTFIVKPEDQSQGRGIFLTRKGEELKPTDQLVVQKYIAKPHLLDGFKYDLRIYVLLIGIAPLRVYVFKDGLARLAAEKYEKPADKNFKNLCMHLTNYAINKFHEDFIQNESAEKDDVGSKRSLRSVLDGIEMEEGEEVAAKLQWRIYDMIIKSLCLASPHVTHLIKTCQPDDIENQMCF